MLIKVISLSFDSASGGFNDQDVRDFLKDKELISSKEYFFIRNDIPYLTFVFNYFPHRAEVDPKLLSKEKQTQTEPWKALLSEADMGLFNLLRDWRSQKSKKEGLPPYILFTNQQLAMIVKKRPQTASELIQIEGVGKAKVQKYGEDVLGFTKINTGEEQKAAETNAT